MAIKEIKRLVFSRTFCFLPCACVLLLSTIVYLSVFLLRSQTSSEQNALQSLRQMTRGGVLPADDVLVRFESQFPGTKLAGLARIVRARIKIAASDFAGGAALLDADVIRDRTILGDHAAFMRGDALEQAGQLAEARIAYERLIADYPSSIRIREARLRIAKIMIRSGQAAAVPKLLEGLADRADGAALLLTARAYESQGDRPKAIAAYRRIYFFAPATSESTEAAAELVRRGVSTAAGTEEEALARANGLYDTKRFKDAFDAYSELSRAFPNAYNDQAKLRQGISASNVRRSEDAISALNRISLSAGEIRAEALMYLAQTYARTRQWELARSTCDELRRNFPNSVFTTRALVAVGQSALESKNQSDATYFMRTAVDYNPGSKEVAQSQFDLAWMAHDAKDFKESSRLLTEHLAFYTDKTTDNRGRAGYWAGRDSERSGKIAEALALYEAMQARYDANWYGYLAKQRLVALGPNAKTKKDFTPDSVIGKAVANLKTVTVAEETAGEAQEVSLEKADQLTNTGLMDWALEELAEASKSVPYSPKVNLAVAQVYRSQEDNVRALNALRTSFPDYSQMKPEEMTREQWDVFYPLAYWDIIVEESKSRNLDPYQVAGLIRQETIFTTRARSSANAYGLMQVLVPTAALTAKKYGIADRITAEALYEPRLNIKLGTAYLRDQIDRFGRIEYVAAAYNAGPIRVVRWQSSLPSDIDDWAESIPLKETRGYVQGVVRNRLQYERLYDKDGKFRSPVGVNPVSAPPRVKPGASPVSPVISTVRKRRVMADENEE